MSRCVRSSKDKNIRIITQIGKDEYLIEGTSDWARFGCQSDPSIITSVHLEDGLFLLTGDSFLGKGTIATIQNIESDTEDYFIFKIRLHPYQKDSKNG